MYCVLLPSTAYVAWDEQRKRRTINYIDHIDDIRIVHNDQIAYFVSNHAHFCTITAAIMSFLMKRRTISQVE